MWPVTASYAFVIGSEEKQLQIKACCSRKKLSGQPITIGTFLIFTSREWTGWTGAIYNSDTILTTVFNIMHHLSSIFV